MASGTLLNWMYNADGRLCLLDRSDGVEQPYKLTTPGASLRRLSTSSSRTNRREISHDSMSTSRMTLMAQGTVPPFLFEVPTQLASKTLA